MDVQVAKSLTDSDNRDTLGEGLRGAQSLGGHCSRIDGVLALIIVPPE
jgi:hypothetical protein